MLADFKTFLIDEILDLYGYFIKSKNQKFEAQIVHFHCSMDLAEVKLRP